MAFVAPEIRYRQGIPADAIAPREEELDHERPLLVLGELPTDLAEYARVHAVEIVRVATVQRALEHLAVMAFRAIAISPEIEGAIELVKHVKYGDPTGENAAAWEAASRNMLTPILVLPFRGDDEYAVIVLPPEAAYLERTRNLPLSKALFRLNVSALVDGLFRA